MPYRRCQEVHGQIDLRAKLVVQLLKVWVFSQDGVYVLLESGAFFLFGRDGAVGDMVMDALLPAGQCFIAPRHTEIHRKTDGATDIMTGDRMVREGIRVVAMMIMAVPRVKQTADMFAQGVIEDQCRVRLRHTDLLRLLEERRDPPVIDVLLEPRRIGEEPGQVGFVSALQHTARDIGQAFVVQDDQACQVVLKMAKLAPILKEISKNIRVGGHDGSGRYDGKLHATFALSPRG